MKKRIIYRSAITGKFVSKEFANENPDTTVREQKEVKPRKAKGSES